MISIIIPTYQESGQIGKTISWIRRKSNAQLISEIIVSDGGSRDETLEEAKEAGVLAVLSPLKGRSAQMNYGASLATGSVLYFLHADTLPPENFTDDIVNAISKGYDAGCYMLSFDHDHWFLKAN